MGTCQTAPRLRYHQASFPALGKLVWKPDDNEDEGGHFILHLPHIYTSPQYLFVINAFSSPRHPPSGRALVLY